MALQSAELERRGVELPRQLGILIDALVFPETQLWKTRPELIFPPPGAAVIVPELDFADPDVVRHEAISQVLSHSEPKFTLSVQRREDETTNFSLFVSRDQSTRGDWEAHFQTSSSADLILIKAGVSYRAQPINAHIEDDVIQDEIIEWLGLLSQGGMILKPHRLMTEEEHTQWLDIAYQLTTTGRKFSLKRSAHEISIYQGFLDRYGTVMVGRDTFTLLLGEPRNTSFLIQIVEGERIIGYSECMVTTFVTPPGEGQVEPLINFGHGLAELKEAMSGEEVSEQLTRITPFRGGHLIVPQ